MVIGLCLPVLEVFNRAWSRTQQVQAAQRSTLTLSYRLRQDCRPESLQVAAYGQDLLAVLRAQLDLPVGRRKLASASSSSRR